LFFEYVIFAFIFFIRDAPTFLDLKRSRKNVLKIQKIDFYEETYAKMAHLLPLALQAALSGHSSHISELNAQKWSSDLNSNVTQNAIEMLIGHKAVGAGSSNTNYRLGSQGLEEVYTGDCVPTIDRYGKHMCFPNIEELMDNLGLLSQSISSSSSSSSTSSTTKWKCANGYAFLLFYVYSGGNDQHTNVLVFNKNKKKAWLFDPNGSENIPSAVHNILTEYFKLYSWLGYKYAKKHFPDIHVHDGVSKGLCSIWSIFAIHCMHCSQKSSVVSVLAQMTSEERNSIIFKYLNYFGATIGDLK
jgi:hypothetical protein